MDQSSFGDLLREVGRGGFWGLWKGIDDMGGDSLVLEGVMGVMCSSHKPCYSTLCCTTQGPLKNAICQMIGRT